MIEGANEKGQGRMEDQFKLQVQELGPESYAREEAGDQSGVEKIRRGSGEEIPLVQGKEQWLCFAGAVVNRLKGSPLFRPEGRNGP